MWFQQWLPEIFMDVDVEFFFILIPLFSHIEPMWTFQCSWIKMSFAMSMLTEKLSVSKWTVFNRPTVTSLCTHISHEKSQHINQWKNCSFIENVIVGIAVVFISKSIQVGCVYCMIFPLLLPTIACIGFDETLACSNAIFSGRLRFI